MWGLVWRAVRTARGAAGLHVGLAVLSTVAVVAEPAALAGAANAVLEGREVWGAWGWLAAVLVGGLLIRSTGGLAGAIVDLSATRMLRTVLLRHSMRLATPQRQPFATGDLVSRVSMDASMPGVVLPVMVQFGLGAAIGLSGLVGLALIDWATALVLLGGAGLGAWIVRRFVVDFSGPVTRYQQARGELAARLLDACRGARTIRASGTLAQEVERVLRPLSGLRAAADEQWQAQRRLVFRVSLTHPLLQALVLGVAGVGLAQGRLAAGDLLAVLGYSALVLGIFDQVDSVSEALYVRTGARRVLEVLEHPVALPEADAPRDLPDEPLGLRLEAVSLRHGDQAVLDRVELSVPAGAHVAVVGSSGSGKSSLCALAGRLADPDGGRVLLGGQDLRELADDQVRRRVTYAFERPELFGATVGEALAAGRPGVPLERIVAAATAARAHDFIARLPEGYDTGLGELLLSGGEIQRLGIARALVDDTSLIVLDDATSSLDTATEAELWAAIRQAWQGRTALLVARRAVTAAEADLVAWLDRGTLRALAPHRELWAEADYRALFGQSVHLDDLPSTLETTLEVSR